MSQIQSQARVASDFSITRILAEDNFRKSRESFLVESAGPNTGDEGLLLLRSGSRQAERPVSFSQRELNSAESLGCSRLAAEYVHDRRANIYHSPFASFGGDSRCERFSSLKSLSESSARTTSEIKTVKIERSELSWLQCTRYRPPKLPRKSVTGKSSKRRPGAHPRIPFTATQLQVLEDKYRRTAYLSRRDVIQLSTTLRLPQSRVKIWFQNRRARDRRESTISGSNVTILSNDAPSTDNSKGVPGGEPMTPSLI